MYYCANYSPDENKIEKRTLRVFRAAASEQTLTGMEFLPDGVCFSAEADRANVKMREICVRSRKKGRFPINFFIIQSDDMYEANFRSAMRRTTGPAPAP